MPESWLKAAMAMARRMTLRFCLTKKGALVALRARSCSI